MAGWIIVATLLTVGAGGALWDAVRGRQPRAPRLIDPTSERGAAWLDEHEAGR